MYDNPKLTIVISCLGTGIENIEKAISYKNPHLRYLIVHQNKIKISIPDFLNREDVTVINSETKGLAKSRNIGLKSCKTEFALIGDDDVEYIPDGLERLLRIINDEKPDFATFKILTPEGEPEYKQYSKEKFEIASKFRHWFSSIEILLNVPKIVNNNISFDERFGLGTILKSGEEEVFIHDCIKNNLKGRFYPIYIVRHPYASSGKKQRKMSEQMFFWGALSVRNKATYGKTFHVKRIRKYKNILFFNLGKFYVKLTNFLS